MDIKTVYEIGDEVWHVFSRTRREIENCTVCGGAGKARVLGTEETISCPKCWGKGESETGEPYQQHVVSHAAMTVGKVTVSVEGPTHGTPRATDAVDVSNLGPRSYKREEVYMCVQTGVGSGSVYRVDDLYPTREEAEAVARARTQASADSITRYDEVDGEDEEPPV